MNISKVTDRVKEQRGQMVAKPSDYLSYINEPQQTMLNRLTGKGWSVEFIRRPLFKEAILVVRSADGRQFGTINKDGLLHLNTELKLRDIR